MTPPNRRNYCRILHLQLDAPDAMIRTACRTLMQKLHQHPDLGGDGATATFINEAHAALSDRGRHADRAGWRTLCLLPGRHTRRDIRRARPTRG